jgi:hypothetical protein
MYKNGTLLNAPNKHYKALNNGKIQKSPCDNVHTILILSLLFLLFSLLLLFLLFNKPHVVEKRHGKCSVTTFSSSSVQLSLQPNTALASGRGGGSPFEDEKIESFQFKVDESSFRMSEETPKI